jgi:hypothetical protein
VAKQTLATFGNSSSDFLKMFAVAEGKVGKTTYLAASALGALPHQTEGLVDKAENLHLFGFDEAFVDGLLKFLKDSCKKGDSYLNVSVHDLTETVRKSSGGSDWNFGVLNAVMAELQSVKSDVQKGGVHAIIFSSLTGLANGIEAGLAGAVNPAKKGAGMDMAKWGSFNQQLNAVRNAAQSDTHHTFWEGHITKTRAKDEEDQKDTVSISGKVGQNWGFNVEQVVRLRREMAKYPNTTIDKVYMDTRPTLDFVAGGRGFNESLQQKEYDLVEMAKKLGKKVGGFKG